MKAAQAMSFAREAHGDQMYGEHPYIKHLAAVVAVLLDYHASYPENQFDDLLCAAWLHDVIEDTDTLKEHIQVRFGIRVANLVWACTGEGANRQERNASIYRKIATFPEAAIIKCADRIANVEYSAPGSKHRQMYRREMNAFSDVIQDHVPLRMWDRLERAFTIGELSVAEAF